MKRKTIMLVGRSGAGKTSFLQAMNGENMHYKKTQSVEFVNGTIDTPGEYMENRRLYRALIVTAAEADLILLVQDCTDTQNVYPPGFSSMFAKPCIGLVTKVDLAESEEQLRNAEEVLEMAGCSAIIRTSSFEHTGVDQVLEYIQSEGM